jgi:hypothetical protein
MTLLLRDPDVKADDPAGAMPPEAPPEARTCPKCQAPLADGQDWCLSCGEAQPSRFAGLPGKRAAATVLALTTVLVGGAVAASYAALNDAPAPDRTPTQLAQASTATPAPTGDAAATAAAAAAAAAQASSAVPAAPTAPAPADTSTTPPAAGVTPVTPTPSPTPPASTGSGAASSGATGSGSTGSGSTSGTSGSGTSTSTKDGTKAGTRTTTTTSPADATPVPIKLDASAATLYDPYTRNTATGDATKMLDGDPGTSFPITVAPGSGSIAAGVTVDVGKTRGIREVDLTIKTPGGKVEIYATDSDVLPPDVLDTRWAHLKDVSGLGSADGGKQAIALGSGTTKYRHLLLWFTAPPTDGLTVRVAELKLLG